MTRKKIIWGVKILNYHHDALNNKSTASKAVQFLKTKRHFNSFTKDQKSVFIFCKNFNVNKLRNYTFKNLTSKYSRNTDGFSDTSCPTLTCGATVSKYEGNSVPLCLVVVATFYYMGNIIHCFLCNC